MVEAFSRINDADADADANANGDGNADAEIVKKPKRSISAQIFWLS